MMEHFKDPFTWAMCIVVIIILAIMDALFGGGIFNGGGI